MTLTDAPAGGVDLRAGPEQNRNQWAATAARPETRRLLRRPGWGSIVQRRRPDKIVACPPLLQSEEPPMDRLRVLIVEDDPHSRKVIAALFVRSGWEAIEAATVAEGMAGLAPVPECIILDLSLPDGGGETILKKILGDEIPIRVIAVVSGES